MTMLGIQGSCIKYARPWSSEKKLTKEMSKCLGQNWQPMGDIASNVALWGIVDPLPVPDNEYGTGPVS